MKPKIIKKVQWDKVLKDVSYNHTTDSIEFGLKDIDSLLKYIGDLKSRMDSKTLVAEKLKRENDRLKSQLLMEALKEKPQPISSFIKYA